MSNLADECHTQGLLYLDDIQDDTGNKFLKIAIKLIVSGFDADFIREVLENIIIVEECDNKSLLEKILILEAVIKIHDGFSSDVVKPILLSLLGEKWLIAYIDKEFHEFSGKLDISEDEQRIQELVFDKNENSAKEDHIYFKLLESIKKTLKSFNFFNRLAALYRLGEVKNQDMVKINKITEEVLLIIDENITSAIIELEDDISSYCRARHRVLDRLLTLMSNHGYIKFDDTARLACERIISSREAESDFNESKIADMKNEFPGRINEFLKLVMIIIVENAKIYDFNTISKALLRTIVEGKEAEELRGEFTRIL